MDQTSEIAVEVTWLNLHESLSLYPGILDGFKIEKTLCSPSREYYFLSSETEAQELKDHLEQHLPSHDYRAVNDANQPIPDNAGKNFIRHEPYIEIVAVPKRAKNKTPQVPADNNGRARGDAAQRAETDKTLDDYGKRIGC